MTPRLVPDVVAVERPGPRAALLLRPREHEGLVAELVERRAQLAADHGLAAVEPLADDPDAHHASQQAARRPSTVRCQLRSPSRSSIAPCGEPLALAGVAEPLDRRR